MSLYNRVASIVRPPVCLFVRPCVNFYANRFLGQFGLTARCRDDNFFVSNITKKRLDRFAWNFQGRCGVTMGQIHCSCRKRFLRGNRQFGTPWYNSKSLNIWRSMDTSLMSWCIWTKVVWCK